MADTNSMVRSNYFKVKDYDVFTAELDALQIDYGPERSHSAITLIKEEQGINAGSVMFYTYDFLPNLDEENLREMSGIQEDDENNEELSEKDRMYAKAFTEVLKKGYEEITDVIAAHIVEDEVCIIMGIGYEKMRYLEGWAVAVTHEGTKETTNLEDIYDMVKKRLPDYKVTKAAY